MGIQRHLRQRETSLCVQTTSGEATDYHRIYEFLTGYFTGSGGGDRVKEQEIRSEGVQGGEAAGDHLGQPGGDPGTGGPLLCTCGVNKG